MTLWVLEAIFKSIQLYRQTSILRVCVHVRARRGVRVVCAVSFARERRDSQTKACVKAKGLQSTVQPQGLHNTQKAAFLAKVGLFENERMNRRPPQSRRTHHDTHTRHGAGQQTLEKKLC